MHFSELKLKILVSGAGAALFCLEPELAPGPRTSEAGAAPKSGGSATLIMIQEMFANNQLFLEVNLNNFCVRRGPGAYLTWWSEPAPRLPAAAPQYCQQVIFQRANYKFSIFSLARWPPLGYPTKFRSI